MLDKPAAVYTSGSIFKSATDVLLEALKRKLQAANPQVRVADSVYEPIVGGVILALEKALGGKVSDKILAWKRRWEARYRTRSFKMSMHLPGQTDCCEMKNQ